MPKNFIRTKDGIYEATDWLEDGSCWCLNNGGEYFPKCEIKAEADSPEELCEEIVVKESPSSKPRLLGKLVDFDENGNIVDVKGKYAFNGVAYTLKELMKRFKGISIKGGIWVDENLVCVIKMNSKGDWEII